MSQYVHIVISDSTAGSLKHYLKFHKKYNGKIVSFVDDLSIGCIYKLEENINQRVEFIKNIQRVNGDSHWGDDIATAISNNYCKDLEISKDSKILIWHANGVNEQVALRYLVHRFADYELYEVMLPSNCICYYPDGSKGEQIYKSSGSFDSDMLGKALNRHTQVSEGRKQTLSKEWEVLTNHKGMLRILENNVIQQVQEDYYDNDILKYLTGQPYTKTARVVGYVMGHTLQNVSDFFIHCRIKKLIEIGKLIYKGKLKAMRDYEVSINNIQ